MLFLDEDANDVRETGQRFAAGLLCAELAALGIGQTGEAIGELLEQRHDFLLVIRHGACVCPGQQGIGRNR